jgi:hypothetical protein
MHRTSRVLAAMAMAASCAPAEASIRTFGRSTVKSPLWSGPLEDLVNSPLRVDGMSSLGNTEFYFDGNEAQINDLVATFAKLPDRHLYLTVDDSADHAAVLQIQHRGSETAYLTIHVRSFESLKALELPESLSVDALPPVSEWIDPAKRAAEQRLWKQVQAAVERHQEKNN